MSINGHQLARIMDGTVLDKCSTKADYENLIVQAKKYDLGQVAVGSQCWVPFVAEGLKGTDTKIVTGCSSWHGGDPIEVKQYYAKKILELGAGEVENFLNYSYFKSGMYDEVVKDIAAVREAIGPNVIYKVLLETPLWTDEEIATMCELCIDGGADFVKTATGTLGVTDIHTIEVMAKAVNGRAKIKASGGIRTIETVDAMLDLGVERFGVGLASGIKLIEAADNR